jgi:CDP-glycerol glycerophosphotransferase (TagB/SpsB family)
MQHFFTHLSKEIHSQMKANNYAYNPATSLKEPYSQLMSLQDTFAQTSITKMTIKWVQKIAQDTVSQHLVVAQINQNRLPKTPSNATLRSSPTGVALC